MGGNKHWLEAHCALAGWALAGSKHSLSQAQESFPHDFTTAFIIEKMLKRTETDQNPWLAAA
jgi:hypothetical protein